MWLEAEGAHKRLVNTFALDILYVSYKGNGSWTVCGAIGSNDFVLKTCTTEAAANMELTQILAKIKNDKGP